MIDCLIVKFDFCSTSVTFAVKYSRGFCYLKPGIVGYKLHSEPGLCFKFFLTTHDNVRFHQG